jgi:plastocyanin
MIAAAVLLAAASVACGGDTPTGGTGSHSPQITVGDNYFSPMTVNIAPGDTVIWIWGGAVGHNVIFTGAPATPPADCGTISSGVCIRAFGTTKGAYNYVCSLHAGMTGTINIQ